MKSLCEQVTLYFYDELDAAQRKAFAAHLQNCPACQQELAFLAQTQAALVPPAAPQELVQRVLQKRKTPAWKHWLKPVSAAVCVALLGAYALFGWFVSPTDQTTADSWVAYVSEEADAEYQLFVSDFEAFEAEFE